MQEEHEEIMPSPEEARQITDAVDAFLAAIRGMGPQYGTLLAVSAPGDQCMVASQMPEDRTRVLQLVTVMVSWIAARAGWSPDDVQVYTDEIAREVKRHIELRRQRQEN